MNQHLSTALWVTPPTPIPPDPTPPIPPPPANILSQADFTLKGYYDVDVSDAGYYGIGFSHRVVNGQVRFFIINAGNGRLYELARPANYGDAITVAMQTWDPYDGVSYNVIGGSRKCGIYWNEATQQLWDVTAVSYPNAEQGLRTLAFYSRSLNANGTISGLHGLIGMEGVPARRHFGGFQPVPTWFQQTYGTQAYCTGWGGYSSVIALGPVSLGPSFYTLPNFTAYAPDTDIPANLIRTGADHSSGVREDDWYLHGGLTPTSFDRGVRVTTDVVNYFDANDPRHNPSTRPTEPPTPGNWLSPAPDGLGRWIWGDNYHGTGVWIDGAVKQGFVCVASLCKGFGWYHTGALEFDEIEFEFHVFNPTHYGEVIQGTRQPWQVKPTTLWAHSFAGFGVNGPHLVGDLLVGQMAGASWNAATKEYFVFGAATDAGSGRIFVFDVNC